MTNEEIEAGVRQIIPTIWEFFESRGYEGITESVEKYTKLPQIGTIASDFDYQMSLTPKEYIGDDPFYELLFLKRNEDHQKLITLLPQAGHWKAKYKDQEFYFTEQILQAVYDQE
ncbi:hypothetical protein [Pseudomonas aeruginosa]|uniref:hypothetical protein n=1 Tax=Pseudomonas aeruginosa TaxID=287 RepID=UPI0015E42EFA|nr:hypothetical protein [Pseudomonas aeruginosa]MBA1286590.1 hypothetical protein [Pseudomonas aeruginosa]